MASILVVEHLKEVGPKLLQSFLTASFRSLAIVSNQSMKSMKSMKHGKSASRAIKMDFASVRASNAGWWINAPRIQGSFAPTIRNRSCVLRKLEEIKADFQEKVESSDDIEKLDPLILDWLDAKLSAEIRPLCRSNKISMKSRAAAHESRRAKAKNRKATLKRPSSTMASLSVLPRASSNYKHLPPWQRPGTKMSWGRPKIGRPKRGTWDASLSSRGARQWTRANGRK